MTSDQEYDALRAELQDGRKYIFERPLVIAALATAGAQFLDKPPALILPPVLAVLSVFNFWFTVNRIRSACRMVAYIQLVLEPSATVPWLGWETSLREYRKWIKRNGDASTASVTSRIDHDAVPDALTYYPSLYYFHMGLIGGATLIALGLLIQYGTPWRWGCFLITAVLGAWSVVYLKRWRPSVMKDAIERQRVLWQSTLKERDKVGTTSRQAV